MSGSTIRFNTSLGAVDIRTRPDAAPKTVEVMLDLVRKGLFNGVSFYRAEKDFVIQGGLTEPSGKARKSPHGNIPLEYKLPNKRGTVTMARWTEPDTATSEFFINLFVVGSLLGIRLGLGLGLAPLTFPPPCSHTFW